MSKKRMAAGALLIFATCVPMALAQAPSHAQQTGAAERTQEHVEGRIGDIVAQVPLAPLPNGDDGRRLLRIGDTTDVTRGADGLAAVQMSEGFEGSWPAARWSEEDYSDDDGGQYFWGKSDCIRHSGAWALRSGAGGSNGRSLRCDQPYPNYLNSWTSYGPFSLRQATSATFTYYFYGALEQASGTTCFDKFIVGSSLDNETYSGTARCGQWIQGTDGGGFYRGTLDLSERLGQDRVYVVIGFQSDLSVTAGGIWLDDLTLDVGAIPRPTHRPVVCGPNSPCNFLPYVVQFQYRTPTPAPTAIPTPTEMPWSWWQVDNQIGGDLYAELRGYASHVFPPGVTTWGPIRPGTYSYLIRALGGPCEGQGGTGTITFLPGETIPDGYTCD